MMLRGKVLQFLQKQKSYRLFATSRCILSDSSVSPGGFSELKSSPFTNTDSIIWTSSTIPEGSESFDYTVQITALKNTNKTTKEIEKYISEASSKYGHFRAAKSCIGIILIGSVYILISFLRGETEKATFFRKIALTVVAPFILLPIMLFGNRRHSPAYRMFFNRNSGVTTILGSNLGIRAKETFINIPPNCETFHLTKQPQEVLNLPEWNKTDLSYQDTIAKMMNSKVSSGHGKDIGVFITISSSLDLNALGGPIDTHLLSIEKDYFFGIMDKVEEEKEVLKYSKFGRALLMLENIELTENQTEML